MNWQLCTILSLIRMQFVRDLHLAGRWSSCIWLPGRSLALCAVLTLDYTSCERLIHRLQKVPYLPLAACQDAPARTCAAVS